MAGTVFKSKSKSGRTTWRYQIQAGRDEEGGRIRVGESGFRLEREANGAMYEKMQELKRGPAKATTSTLSEYLEQ